MTKQAVKLEGFSQRIGAAPGETLVDQIAYYARVSNPTSQMSGLKNQGLINYLIRHEHWSPFEMVSVNCQIDTTRDIGRQILRHASMRFQEFSQRYSATETTGDTRETRKQDYLNRQNSIETDDKDLEDWWNKTQSDVMDLCFESYDQSLKRDIAKEQARALLPEGLTWSRMYMHGTIRSYIHYIQLRSRPETQKEHRDIALMCAKAIEPVFPMITEFVYDEAREEEKRRKMYASLKKEFN